MITYGNICLHWLVIFLLKNILGVLEEYVFDNVYMYKYM